MTDSAGRVRSLPDYWLGFIFGVLFGVCLVLVFL